MIMSHFDAIRDKLRDPGFTPGRRDVGPMLELLAAAEEDEATRVIRALAQVALAAERALAGWEKAEPPLKHRFVALLARAKGDDAHVVMIAALSDADPRTRKAAARALGRVQSTSIRVATIAALRTALASEVRPEVKRAIVEALGKTGGAEDAVSLAPSADEDASTERVRREAVRRITRTEGRALATRIVAERVTEAPFEVELRCREGLESILAGELPGARIERAGRVAAAVSSLRQLTLARTWSAAAIVIHQGADTTDERLAHLIASASPLLRGLTEGPVRWRVEWAGAGHKRAATRELDERVAALAPELVNDPIASDWEIEITRDRGKLDVFAIPKSWDDARFAYRVADVPAASHPTIAAAIARLGGARDEDVVWDPFVGSGLELVERARLGPYRALLGTDVDERALSAARKNLDAARVRDARLERADARTFAARDVTLVLTNPPMGRRIQSGKLDALLGAALENVARILQRGGRLVWITPMPRITNPILENTGMKRTHDHVVDMKGFAANLQRWTR